MNNKDYDAKIKIIKKFHNEKHVIIPDSVTAIGYGAFDGYTSLESITIPNSVTSIGGSAFSGCTSLTSITIPDSVTSIGEEAFRDCTSLTSITIPNSVISIGFRAFDGCTSLTSITIPDSVTSIGYNAFFGCTSLTSITIPDSVTYIGNSVLEHCKINELHHRCLTIENGLCIKNNILEYCSNDSLTTVIIPDSVTSIKNYAFREYTSLTTITIPDSVTSIGGSAFSGCTSLTSITIPDSVTSIGEEAFRDCTSLTTITIPDSVTSIKNYAFSGCTSLASITIPDSVTSIGSSVLEHCKINELHHKCLTIENGLCIKNNILEYCSNASLTTVIIPDSVTSIKFGAFRDCTSLASITIPDSVTSIGFDAFSGCTSLASITIPDSVTSIESSVLKNCKINELHHKCFTIENGLCIKNNILEYCSNDSLTTVIIPDSVTSIGYDAFSGCTSLASITIPDSVTSIGYDAFSGCTSLASITIPDSVTSIGLCAFYGCKSLTSITIPDSVTSIGDCAFYGCKSLTSITIPDSVTSIGDRAFDGCTSLASITIPDAIYHMKGKAEEIMKLVNYGILFHITTQSTHIIADPEENDILERLQRLIELDYTPAYGLLGQYYYFGSTNINSDFCKALQYLEEGAKREDCLSLSILADYYCDKDDKKTFDYAKRAQAAGDIDCCATLGQYYEEGKVTEKNIKKAVECYKLAHGSDWDTVQSFAESRLDELAGSDWVYWIWDEDWTEVNKSWEEILKENNIDEE